MYKDKQKKDYQRGYMRQKRSNKGSNRTDGSNSLSTSEGLTSRDMGLTSLREIAVKLVDPLWRTRIEKISASLGSLSGEVRLNGVTMSTWRKLLDVVSTSI